MQAETKAPDKAALQTDYRVLVQIHRGALADANMLEEYLQQRGDRFDDEGNDYITLLQAKMLGLLDSTPSPNNEKAAS